MQADQAFGSVGAAGNEAGVSMVRKALVRRGGAAAAALMVIMVLILIGWSHETESANFKALKVYSVQYNKKASGQKS